MENHAESRSDPSEATGSWSAAFPDQRNSPPRLSVWISSWFKMHRIKKWATKKRERKWYKMNSPKKYSWKQVWSQQPEKTKTSQCECLAQSESQCEKFSQCELPTSVVKAPSQCERAFSILNSSLRHILETIWQYEFVRTQGSADEQKRSHNRLGQRSQSDPSFKTRRKGWLLQSIFEVAGLAFFKWFPEMVEWKPLLSRETNSCLFETRPT